MFRLLPVIPRVSVVEQVEERKEGEMTFAAPAT